jgi:hypothetical protein
MAQVSGLDPPPVFFAQLGDFAGPGTAERHEHYLGLVAGLPIPDVCVVGNPREADLALDGALEAAEEPHRVVLMHMPPYLDGRFAPHTEWGFRQREAEFLALLHARGVGLVCCAHGLAFDECVHDGIRFVMSGGGGSGLCSHVRGVCTEGAGRPEDRGSLFPRRGDLHRGGRHDRRPGHPGLRPGRRGPHPLRRRDLGGHVRGQTPAVAVRVRAGSRTV